MYLLHQTTQDCKRENKIHKGEEPNTKNNQWTRRKIIKWPTKSFFGHVRVSHPPRAPLSIATYHANEYPKIIVQEIHKRKFSS
jgi:hypothetical protein